MPDYYLSHHGILGMKWGIRRYQNKDGSLTTKGKIRFNDVSNSDRLSKRDTKDAIKIYRSKAKLSGQRAIVKEAASQKAYQKSDLKKYKSLMTEKSINEKMSKEFNKKIKDISSGTFKAGKDFIVQRDYNLYVFPVPTPGGLIVGGMVTKNASVIERKK